MVHRMRAKDGRMKYASPPDTVLHGPNTLDMSGASKGKHWLLMLKCRKVFLCFLFLSFFLFSFLHQQDISGS